MPHKKTKRHHHGKMGKSRRSSATGSGGAQVAGAAALTGVVTSMLDAKMLSKVSNTAKGAVMTAGGIGIAWKAKPIWAKGIGIGLAVWGAIRLAQGVTGATISGIGRMPNYGGFPTPPAIGNPGMNASLSNFPTPPAIGALRRKSGGRHAAFYAGAGL